MAKTAVKKKDFVLGWGFVSPKGVLVNDVFGNKAEARESVYYITGYKPVRVKVSFYKK